MAKEVCDKNTSANNNKNKCRNCVRDKHLEPRKTEIDITYIQNVVNILKENDLSEIKYESNGITIKVVAQALNYSQSNYQPVVNSSPLSNLSSVSNKQLSSENTVESVTDYINHPGAIKSPMVGTCYLAPEPNATKFVSNGETVKKDQPLLIIEAMKVMNYIKSPRDGKVIHIAVEDAQPIEFGQLLMVIE